MNKINEIRNKLSDLKKKKAIALKSLSLLRKEIDDTEYLLSKAVREDKNEDRKEATDILIQHVLWDGNTLKSGIEKSGVRKDRASAVLKDYFKKEMPVAYKELCGEYKFPNGYTAHYYEPSITDMQKLIKDLR